MKRFLITAVRFAVTAMLSGYLGLIVMPFIIDGEVSFTATKAIAIPTAALPLSLFVALLDSKYGKKTHTSGMDDAKTYESSNSLNDSYANKGTLKRREKILCALLIITLTINGIVLACLWMNSPGVYFTVLSVIVINVPLVWAMLYHLKKYLCERKG